MDCFSARASAPARSVVVVVMLSPTSSARPAPPFLTTRRRLYEYNFREPPGSGGRRPTGPGMIRLSREYESHMAHLGEMRALVADVCRQAWGEQADEEAVGACQLALDEAFTNVIRHAYGGEPGHAVELVVEAHPDRVCLTLYHGGREFDPAAVAPPSFDGSRSGGFGLYLMRQLADEVSFFRGDDGRQGVRLLRKRTPAAPAGGGEEHSWQ